MESFLLAVTVFTDPQETFYMVKMNRSRRFNYLTPAVLFVAFFLVRIFQIYATHYPLSSIPVWDTNLFTETAKYGIPLLSWMIASYAMSTLLDGESKIREVFLACGLSLVPYIVFTPLLVALSHVMSTSEKGIYDTLLLLIWVWVIVLFFLNTMVLNDYTVAKTIGVALLSIGFILVLWTIVILLFALADQFIKFIGDLWKEVRINFM